MWKSETRTVINILEAGDLSRKTVHRTIMLLIKLDEQINRLYKNLNETAKEQYINGRNDGIREFAEIVKKNQRRLFNAIYSEPHFGEIINNLVKEMTEKDNGTK